VLESSLGRGDLEPLGDLFGGDDALAGGTGGIEHVNSVAEELVEVAVPAEDEAVLVLGVPCCRRDDVVGFVFVLSIQGSPMALSPRLTLGRLLIGSGVSPGRLAL
jgi:hypothetical protein